MKPRSPLSILVGLLFALASSAIGGPVGDWDPGFGFPLPGVDGSVTSAVVWNGELVIAGSFNAVGHTPAQGIARFDGTVWRAMDRGLRSAVSLVVHDGELVAAGRATGGATGIFRWDGVEWQSIGGTGISGGLYILRRLVAWNGSLVIAGSFSAVDGVSCTNIARWDGSQWHPLGSDLTNLVDALTVYDGDLVAGGWHFVRRWSGSTWNPIALGMQGEVYDLAAHGARLIATGSFWSMGGPGTVLNIASFGGIAWAPLGSGLDGWGSSLLSAGGDLYVGGGFESAGGQPAAHIARWDGSTWQPLGEGCNSPAEPLVFHDGDLLVGGSFTQAGDLDCRGFARWDGSTWSLIVDESGAGLDDAVDAMTAHNGEIIAAGDFTNAGGVPASGLARWDGSQWHDLGPVSPYPGTIHALLSWNGSLYAGGGFTGIDGNQIRFLARYDGSGWHPVAGELDGSVEAIAVFQGRLVVTGQFSHAGSTRCERIAVLDGEEWQPLGDGLFLADWWTGENVGYGSALQAVGDDLYAGGHFQTAGAVEAWNIARWDGEQWHPVGGGIGGDNDEVLTLAWWDGMLYAGGAFWIDGVEAQNIACWDGSTWSEVAGGVNHVVDCILPYEDGVVVAGMFDYVDGAPGPRCLIHWDGENWSAFYDGVGGDSLARVYCASVLGGDLFIGGRFLTAAGIPSAYIGRWVSSVSGAAEASASGPAIRVPAPYRPGSTIFWSATPAISARASIFDAAGRLVADLPVGVAAGGSAELRWDGRTPGGQSAAPGVYFLRVEERSRSATARVVLLER